MEYLNITNNPVDLRLTGMEGRRVVLAETAKTLDLDAPSVKTQEQFEQDEAREAAAQMAAIELGQVRQEQGGVPTVAPAA
jgi:hypothetical protein